MKEGIKYACLYITDGKIVETIKKDNNFQNIVKKIVEERSTCAKIAHMGNNGKQDYNTKYYNLDVIISIGKTLLNNIQIINTK